VPSQFLNKITSPPSCSDFSSLMMCSLSLTWHNNNRKPEPYNDLINSRWTKSSPALWEAVSLICIRHNIGIKRLSKHSSMPTLNAKTYCVWMAPYCVNTLRTLICWLLKTKEQLKTDSTSKNKVILFKLFLVDSNYISVCSSNKAIIWLQKTNKKTTTTTTAYVFEMTWGGVNVHRIFIFGRTIPLSTENKSKMSSSIRFCHLLHPFR